MPNEIFIHRAKLLADHYHRAAEQASARWQERNRQFLFLVGVLALAVLMTAKQGQTDTFFLYIVGKLAGVPDTDVAKVRESFPYVVLHGLLVVLVFYFMTDVFRLNANIIRNYAYLRGLERDLRDELAMHPASTAFSKETDFYEAFKVRGSGAIKYAYVLLVGGMLAFFLVFRVTSDWPSNGFDVVQLRSWQTFTPWLERHLLLLVDLVVGGMTVLMYLAYAWLSISPPEFEPKAPGKLTGELA
jgi:hypothetical protein